MSKAIRASVLLLLLTSSAQAGWMGNGSAEPPPPPPPSIVEEEQTADGYIQNDEPESLTETVLSVLESVLALF